MKHIRKRTLSILLTLVMLFSLVPGMSLTAYAADTTITWTNPYVNMFNVNDSYTDSGITVTMTAMEQGGWFGDSMMSGGTGTFVFSSSVGNIKGIVITAENVDYFNDDWSIGSNETTLTWSGTPASSVTLSSRPIAIYEISSIVFTIEGANVDVTGVTLDKTSTTLTVGGTETLTATVAPDDATDKTVTWASDNESVATVADGVVTAVAAGTANITVTTTDGSFTDTCAVTVTKPTVAATAEGYTGTYDDTAHGVTVIVTTPASGATIKYGTVEGTYDQDTSPTITDVSDSPLTVYYQVTAEGYDPAAGSATVTISKADQDAPAAPTADSVSATSVTLTAITNGEYSKDGTTWQESPTFTGLTKNTEYTFYQRLVGDANHNASPASSANISTSNHAHSWSYEASGDTITATCGNTDNGHDGETTATLTIAAPEHSVYGDGKSAEATITGSIDGVDAPAIEYINLNETLTAAPTDAGENYVAQITLGEATAHVDYTIAKADITPTVSIDGWTYGETANDPSVTGNTGNGAVTYTYAVKGSSDFSAAVPTNAGDYTVKATVAATDNYNSGEATADFTISKTGITPTVSLEGWTYGETAKTPTVTGNSGNGEVTYTYSDKTDGTYAATVPTNAGTYYVKADVAETDNYNAAASEPVSFEIAKAAITITPDDKSSKYGEDIAELTYQVGGAYKAGDDLGVTVSTTATKTSDVGEYEITASWNENPNYTATLNTGKYTVTKTALSVTATGYSGAYDGKAHGITVEVSGSGATAYYSETELTADNYTTAGSTTAPTRTDAGTTTVYYYVEGKNYDAVSGSKTIEITKAGNAAAAPAEISMWDAESAYVAAEDGQEYVIAPKGGTPDWTKAVEGNAEGYVQFENLTPATEYEIYTRVKADANHNPGEAVKTELLTSLYGLEMMDELKVGETITVKPDPADAEGLSYQWYYAEEDDGAVTRGDIIDGADSASYTIQPADYGKTLWVEVTKNGKELMDAYYGPVGGDLAVTSVTGVTGTGEYVWTKDSGKDAVITVKLTNADIEDDSFDRFLDVAIDDTPLELGKDYTVAKGGTVVTLKAATLQKLSVGKHTVDIFFDNGLTGIELTVAPAPTPAKDPVPNTGDASGAAVWLAVLALCAFGLGAAVVTDRKRRVTGK